MKVALCLSGIVGGFSGRNGSGLQIPVQLCRDEWHRALFNNYDTDVFIHSWDLENQKAITEKLLDEFNLQHLRSLNASVLSGGERARVALSRVMINNPKVILLDEVLSNLDPIVVQDIQKYQRATSRMANGGANGKIKKPVMPGHVRASINWNTMRDAYKDSYSLPIMDGQKVIVCKLKANPMNFTSIAYPIDELNLPSWFKELPFDHETMEQTIVDQKVSNLMSELGWDLESTKTSTVFDNLFEAV